MKSIVITILYIVFCLCRAHVPSLHVLECYSIIEYILQLPLPPPPSHPSKAPLSFSWSYSYPLAQYQFALCVMKPEGGVDCWLLVGQRRRNCIQGPTSSCLIKRGHSLEAERPVCILWWVFSFIFLLISRRVSHCLRRATFLPCSSSK